MSARLDAIDRKILAELQADAGQSLDAIAGKVGSSKTPVWNRIRKMREAGVIGPQTVIVDAERARVRGLFLRADPHLGARGRLAGGIPPGAARRAPR